MTMKRVFIIAALCAVLPWVGRAQVRKEVEVTKTYVPSVDKAAKLPVVPDMTDTTRMRPEIDYTVTPLSLRTALELRPIRPATLTYWEFNRPLPFYVKAGAGYPLNSVFDFYAATQNPGTGYVVGYVNHEGRYADLRNDIGEKHDAVRMLNRIGAAAGKYLGRHILEGELSYENRMEHRYGAWAAPNAASGSAVSPGAMADYSDAELAVRIGDDFQDLSRVNFEVALRGGLFFDHSEWTDYGHKAHQTTLGAEARIARAFGAHRLAASVGYERLAGNRALDDFREQLIRVGVRYGHEGRVTTFEVGVDFCHDRIDGVREYGNYLLPWARFDFNLGTPGLRPFLEADGRVHENSYASLTRQNPYVVPAAMLDKSTVEYNGRFGIGGTLWRERFTYRAYAGFTVLDNRIYWYGTGEYDPAAEMFVSMSGALTPAQGRQTVTSINGELELRPVSALHFSLGLHGYLYNNESPYADGAPVFCGDFGVRYEGRKVAFGVSLAAESARKWTLVDTAALSANAGTQHNGSFEAPFGVDLRVDFDWKISSSVGIFAEGFNLGARKLYRYPWYREYGAGFTAGVKLNF